MSGGARPTVRIGVFLPLKAQLFDMACVDLFGCMGYDYLSGIPGIPAAVSDLAPDVRVYYIGTREAGNVVDLTTGAQLRLTHRLDDPEVQPGKLDVVLVPGPDPTEEMGGPEVAEWLRGHFNHPGTDMLSVCTGLYLFGAAGLLKGRRACGPRALQDDIHDKYPGGDLVGHQLRWVQDGNFWSSGGITNGNDLAAAYARQSRHFPRPVADLAAAMCDVGDRGQEYSQGRAAFGLGLVWVVLRAWALGFGRGGKAKAG